MSILQISIVVFRAEVNLKFNIPGCGAILVLSLECTPAKRAPLDQGRVCTLFAWVPSTGKVTLSGGISCGCTLWKQGPYLRTLPWVLQCFLTAFSKFQGRYCGPHGCRPHGGSVYMANFHGSHILRLHCGGAIVSIHTTSSCTRK